MPNNRAADCHDRSKIDLQDPAQARCWTKQLDVSLDELRNAIETVGNGAAAVRKELSRVKQDD
jgi:uncharacterized membrane protein